MKICPVVSNSTKEDLIRSRNEIRESEGINLTFETLIEGLEKGIKPANLKYIARLGKKKDQAPYGTYFKYDKPIPTDKEQQAIRVMIDKRYSTILRQIPPNKTIDELVEKLRDTLRTQVVNLQVAYPQVIDKYGVSELRVAEAIIEGGLPTPPHKREGIEEAKTELRGRSKKKALEFYKKSPILATFLKAIEDNKYKELGLP